MVDRWDHDTIIDSPASETVIEEMEPSRLSRGHLPSSRQRVSFSFSFPRDTGPDVFSNPTASASSTEPDTPVENKGIRLYSIFPGFWRFHGG